MSDVPDPDLPDLHDLLIGAILDQIRGSEMGRVTRFNSTTQSVSVQPVIMRPLPLLTGGTSVRPVSEIHEMPVWYFGSGDARITFEPAVGDYGLILYCSASHARWKRRGGLVDPGDDRRHDESDAFFLPGGNPLIKLPTPTTPDALVIHPGSKVVRVGGHTGTQKTLMADSFLSALDTLVDAFETALGSLPGAGLTITGPLHTAILAFRGIVRDGYKTTKTEVK